MTDLTGKKLPKVEQVEGIMKSWGKYSDKEFANRFQLDKEAVSTVATAKHLPKIAEY